MVILIQTWIEIAHHRAHTWRRFFTHHAQFIPGVFDATKTPEEYHDESQFLFWSIVCTGARRYTEDPILLERVASQIMGLALPSLYSMSNAIPAIQAVLLLCLWPLPINTMFKDPSHAMIGAAMQLALQNGLHHFDREQDFARTKMTSGEENRLFRARLWMHCVNIFQM